MMDRGLQVRFTLLVCFVRVSKICTKLGRKVLVFQGCVGFLQMSALMSSFGYDKKSKNFPKEVIDCADGREAGCCAIVRLTLVGLVSPK